MEGCQGGGERVKGVGRGRVGVGSEREECEAQGRIRTLPSGWLLMGGLRVSCAAGANDTDQIAEEWIPLNPPRHVPRRSP